MAQDSEYRYYLEANYDQGHVALGSALAELGDLPASLATNEEAIRLKQFGKFNHDTYFGVSSESTYTTNADSLATPYGNLVMAALELDNATKLIPKLREAIRLNPRLAATNVAFSLSVALARTGDVSGAIATIRNAVEQDPDISMDCVGLLRPLVLTLHKKELIKTLRQLREAAKESQALIQWIDRVILLAQRLMASDPRLPRLFHIPAMTRTYPELYDGRRLYIASTALWSAAFEADPHLAERYGSVAACAAAMAGCGKGKDEPPPDDAERAKLRGQALTWLRAELAAHVKIQRNGPPEAREESVNKLARWQKDDDLSGVRDADQLKRLPGEEREAWQAFWAEVASQLNKPVRPKE